MQELIRPLNGLKKNQYVFQDMSAMADNTFKVTDLPDKFLLGKNSFKLHLKEDILVFRSQVYIDIIDSNGGPVYYKIISDNLPNKERIVAVYIYDSTPVGDCEIILAGRLSVNPNTGQKIPYSNDVSSPDYHGIPNVAWRKVVQINPEESEDRIYYSVPPTITYSEIRKPQYQLSTDNRIVSLTPTSSGRATMYSNRGQLTTTDTIKVIGGHLINPDASTATFIPIAAANNDNEIASLYFSGFTLSSSMEGGRVYVNNISYSYPTDASVTQSRVVNYSGSIVKVVSENLCYVNPPLYQVIPYTDVNGNSKDLVIDGFSETNNFTASFRTEPTITINSASYDSYIKLEISNTEPEIGSVKNVSVKAKQINKPGKVVDLGTFKVEKKNLLVVGSDSYTMTSRGIEPQSLGNFKKLGTITTYWTGSNTVGLPIDFALDSNVLDGAKYPNSSYILQKEKDYEEFRLNPQYYPTVYANTEYQLSFDLLLQNQASLLLPVQVDIYISGSEIAVNNEIKNATLSPIKSSRFGTHIGSIDAGKTYRHAVKLYFTAEKSGTVTPVFVNRSNSAIYGNIELCVRNEPGYSSKFLDLEIPLPSEFSSRSELELEVDFLNSNNHSANYKSSLYGVVFQGNTPRTGSGGAAVIPPGTVSGSDQLTGSYDTRYETRGRNIFSSSAQIGPTGIYSGSGTVPRNTVIYANNLAFKTAPNVFGSAVSINYDSVQTGDGAGSVSSTESSGSMNIVTGNDGDDERSYLNIYGNVGGSSIVIGHIDSSSNSFNEYNVGSNEFSFTSGSDSTVFGAGNSSGVYFADNRAVVKGIEYVGNYTSSLMNRDRSIPDVGTVKKIISGSTVSIATGSFATTGSNTFIGNQNIIGSVTSSMLSSSYIDLDILVDSNAPTWREGRLYYDSEHGAFSAYNGNSDVILRIGQESLLRVYNNTGTTISKGAAVKISGSQGDYPYIMLAGANIHTSSYSHENHIIGLASHDIANNASGYVTQRGTIRNINTSNYFAGDQLFLSASSGQLTTVPPIYPFEIIPVATVIRPHSNGILFVEPRYPIHIANINSFSSSTQPRDKDIWVYKSSIGGWYNTNKDLNLTGSFSGSFYGMVSGSDQLTGSYDTRYERRGTGIISSSAQISSDISGSFVSISSSFANRVYSIEQTTGSLNVFTGSAGSRLGRIELTTGSLNVFTGSATSRLSSIELTTGSLNVFTGSVSTRFNRIELTTGSLNLYTGSASSRLASLELTTGSLNTFTGSVSTRFNNIEIKTGSYATTGSNTFRADQIISGSLIITGSLTVPRATGSFSGSFHGQYSSSQQVDYNQIANKINIVTPGANRVFTSDGTVSGSLANKDLTYISSSVINRTRLTNQNQFEQSVSSSFWSSEVTYVTQSYFNFNMGVNVFFMHHHIFKNHDDFSTLTSSFHIASYAVRFETQVLGFSGSLSNPKGTYTWENTAECKVIVSKEHGPTPIISTINTVADSAGTYGSFGTTFAGIANLSSWLAINSISFTAPDQISLRMSMTPTTSSYSFYINSVCRVITNEIRV